MSFCPKLCFDIYPALVYVLVLMYVLMYGLVYELVYALVCVLVCSREYVLVYDLVYAPDFGLGVFSEGLAWCVPLSVPW